MLPSWHHSVVLRLQSRARLTSPSRPTLLTRSRRQDARLRFQSRQLRTVTAETLSSTRHLPSRRKLRRSRIPTANVAPNPISRTPKPNSWKQVGLTPETSWTPVCVTLAVTRPPTTPASNSGARRLQKTATPSASAVLMPVCQLLPVSATS